MPAYMVIMRKGPIRDEAAMAEYQRRTRAMASEVSLRPLAIYGATEALEGEAPDGTILLEFASMDDARAWYHQSEYQAAVPFRQQAGDYEIFIVEGLGQQ